MEIYLWLALSCGSSHSSFDTSIDEVNSAERFAVTNSDLQESLEWFLAEVGAVRLSSLLKFGRIAFSLIPCVQVRFRSLSDDHFEMPTVQLEETFCLRGRSQVSILKIASGKGRPMIK